MIHLIKDHTAWGSSFGATLRADDIEIRPDVMMGKACIKGTRIPVYLVLDKLAARESAEQIMTAYPQLKPEHIKASLEYAAQLAGEHILLTQA